MRTSRLYSRLTTASIVLAVILLLQLGAFYSRTAAAAPKVSAEPLDEITPKRGLTPADLEAIKTFEAARFSKDQQRLADDQQLDVLRVYAAQEKELEDRYLASLRVYEELAERKPNIIKIYYTRKDMRHGSATVFRKLMEAFLDVVDRNSVVLEDQDLELECSTEIADFSSLDVKYPEESIKKLSRAHKQVADAIPGGNPFPDLYNHNGYVMLGGGYRTWTALLGIKALRRTGSTLPVEVFLRRKSDYNQAMCENVFPSLNAQCVVLSDRYGDRISPRLESLEDKALVPFLLLASSYEKVFWMDSNVFAAVSPDDMFESWLGTQYGFFSWRGKYATTLNPAYYEVVRLNPRTPEYTMDESAFLLDKQQNFENLMLAAYYELEGKNSFHKLFGQAKCGAGKHDSLSYATLFCDRREFRSQLLDDMGGLRLQRDPIGEFENMFEEYRPVRPMLYEVDPARLNPEVLTTPGRIFGSHDLTYDVDMLVLETMDLYVCHANDHMFKNVGTFCNDYVEQQRRYLVDHEIAIVNSSPRGLVGRPDDTSDEVKDRANAEVISKLVGVDRLPEWE
ncbi:hypothetical protein KL928_001358 [Ogataea angusta]|uniref:Uncharacterized protein n=1 Tax=Pichia angusta TaxID=870730 RepID=A0AAN6DKD1_PICAN|nr:uncharacterized protein KL928_001358 [Ogataea angusta]KAG7821274.1 hypothetical protein KL928_001358 [Ogataea angusta]